MRKRTLAGSFTFNLLCWAALALVAARAQEFRGTITGTVTDPQGGVVPNATVEIRNLDTNVVSTFRTNESGVYVAPLLIPGRYSVSATASGFKKAVREPVQLYVGARLQVDLTLEVGATTETITVTAEAELLETATASRGQLVDSAKVRDLPLLGRNPFLLAATTPGVYSGLYTGKVASYGRPFDGAAAQMSMQGIGGRYEVLLDGVHNAPPERANHTYVGFVPSPEAVQEFNVQTNIYDAQYGRTSGAIVNVALKSGTNAFHGSLFHYFRHDKLTANLFESNWANRPRAVYRWNQPGVQLDGPVWIPRLYDGRNRTFFMFSFEAIRNSNPNPYVGTVPTELQRQGDFSQTLQANGQPITIYDPLTTHQVGGAWVRDPFPGNRIPGARIDPVAARLTQYWPRPNQPGTITGAFNYVASPNADTDSYNQYAVRLDQQVTENHKLMGRFVRNVRTQTKGDAAFPFPASPPGDFGYKHWRNNYGAALTWTAVLSPRLVWDNRYGWVRHPFGLKRPGDEFDPSALGFPPSLVAQLPRLTFPGVAVTDYATLTAAESQYTTTDTHSVTSTVNRVARTHSIKTGVEFRAMRYNLQMPISNFGTFNFTRAFTQRDALRAEAAAGNAFASFLLGYPASASVPYNIAPAYQALYWAGFIQDDWRLTSRLTLNLGVRWDYESPLSERYDRQNRGFDFNAKSPLQVPGLDLRGGLLFTDKDHRLPFQRDLNNVQPRVGVAYRLFGATVLRGGFGLTYMPSFDTGGNLGFSTSTAYVASTDGGLTPANRLSNPYPTGIIQPPGRSLGLATLLGQNISAGWFGREIPNAWQFSVSLQQQLPFRMVLDVSYAGNRTRDFGTSKNMNFVPVQYLALGSDLLTQVPNPLAGMLPGSAYNGPTVPKQQLLRPYPHFGNVTISQWPYGRTSYNALEASLEKRLSAGLHFRTSYTWCKPMSATGYLNDQDPLERPARAQASQPNHLFVVSGGYALPFFSRSRGATRYALGGWQTNFILRAMTGTLVSAPGGAFSSGVNPKLPKPTMQRWFNTCTVLTTGVRQNCVSPTEPVAWIQQPPFTLRTLSTTLPGIRTHVPVTLDFSLFKDFPVYERMKLQLRAEAFNLANTPGFGAPNTSLTSPSFGQVTPQQANDPRIVQLALRLMF